MMILLPLLFALASGPLPDADPDYKALYETGITFDVFMEQVTARRGLWQRNHVFGDIPDSLIERARAHVRTASGPVYLLAVAVDACSDSVNTIPWLARLAAVVDGLELRIIPPDAGRDIMEAHRTPDGRAATPTVVVLDGQFREIGVFIERPAPLQEWALTTGADLDSRSFVASKGEWYDADAGRTTMEEIVTIMEFNALPLPFRGSFEDDYGYTYDLSARTWSGPGASTYRIVEWNASGQFLIAEQQASTGTESTGAEQPRPATWVRMDWMVLEDMAPYTWGYCMSTYDAPSAEAARMGAPPDRSHPKTGCNGFPFTRMQPRR